MALEQFANNANTVVNNGGIISGSTDPVTFTVLSASGFPSTGNFRILIDSEIMIVTAVSGNNFTASRAAEGTTKVSHADATAVHHILTKGSFYQFLADMNVRDTFANRPAAGILGRKFYCSDTPFWYYDDGTNWQKYYGSFPIVTPDNTGFSSDIPGGVTLTTTYDMLSLNGDTGGGDSIAARYKTAPSTPYTVEAAFLIKPQPTATYWYFLGFRSSSGKYTVMYVVHASAATHIQVGEWYSRTSFNTTIVGANTYSPFGGLPLLRVGDDGTNFTFEISNDGLRWSTISGGPFANNAFLTPAQVCWGYAGDPQCGVDLIHWK